MTVNSYSPPSVIHKKEIDKLVEKSPYYKATSNDVDWLMKVKMQRTHPKNGLTIQSA